MKQIPLGQSSLKSSRLAYGCMRISGTWNPNEITPEKIKRGKQAVLAAYEAGYTLFDHADIYGRGECERIFGEVLKENPRIRRDILIATKCGIRQTGDPSPDSPSRYDFSKKHILSSCEQSLKRLGIETIDLYQLHRPDELGDPQEIAEAFQKLFDQGKVRFFGVSNFLPSRWRSLQAQLPFRLAVNQVQISLACLDCFTDGTLDLCIEQKITPLAWTPLAKGLVASGGVAQPAHPQREGLQKLLDLLDAVALQKEVSRTVISLAWLMQHPSQIIPIIGTTDPQRIKEAAQADQIELSREEWYKIWVAARMKPLP